MGPGEVAGRVGPSGAGWGVGGGGGWAGMGRLGWNGPVSENVYTARKGVCNGGIKERAPIGVEKGK